MAAPHGPAVTVVPASPRAVIGTGAVAAAQTLEAPATGPQAAATTPAPRLDARAATVPLARKAVRPQSAARVPSAPPPSAATSSQNAASELQLLIRARRLVRASPERALELAEQHAALYPQGMFVEEREVLAIEALSDLGRRELAAERARRFAARFGGSTHLQRVAALSGTR